MPKIILLGPPGAGKGTQAQAICRRCNIPQISTGDMLRSAVASGSSTGVQVQAIMQRGELVPDQVILELIQARIHRPDCTHGFLLDGFPRNLAQAVAMAREGIVVDTIIELAASDALIVQRLGGRRVHPASGRVYHIVYNPPKVENTDDISGEPLTHRSDDFPETIKKRLEVYHQQTEPLVRYYQALADKSVCTFNRINAEQSIDQVEHDLVSALPAAV